METIWLGLGSNLCDRRSNLEKAVELLASQVGDGKLSGLWMSKARYVEDQPDFLNAVLKGSTSLGPRELLTFVNGIEKALGRDRSAYVAKGPRPIDIDILLYGSAIIAESDLIIPHPAMRERKFVLLPLLQLDPDLRDPVSGKSFASYLKGMPRQGIYPLSAGGYDAPYP